jgi:hypothetical protein
MRIWKKLWNYNFNIQTESSADESVYQPADRAWSTGVLPPLFYRYKVTETC